MTNEEYEIQLTLELWKEEYEDYANYRGQFVSLRMKHTDLALKGL